jgi:hypothetical protein
MLTRSFPARGAFTEAPAIVEARRRGSSYRGLTSPSHPAGAVAARSEPRAPSFCRDVGFIGI